jgi:hypothetical protein
MIRSQSFLAIPLLVCTIFVSCGKKDAETPASAPAAAPTAAPVAPATAPAAPALVPGISKTLTRNTGDPFYTFDTLGSLNYPVGQKNIQLAADSQITISGWALDVSKNSVAGGVEVVIDKVPYVARYGTPRTDVATHFKRPDYTNSGFLLTLPRGQFNKGPHSVSIRVISNDQKTYNEGPVVPFTVI